MYQLSHNDNVQVNPAAFQSGFPRASAYKPGALWASHDVPINKSIGQIIPPDRIYVQVGKIGKTIKIEERSVRRIGAILESKA